MTAPPFRLLDRELDGTTARFSYALGDDVFVETVTVHADPADLVAADPAALDTALDLLHVALGTSYYKLAAPGRVELARPVTAETLAVARAAYTEGLGEFAAVNDLPLPHAVSWSAQERPTVPTGRPAGAPRRALLPIGGGKDSALALTVVPDGTALAVNPTPAQRHVAEAAGAPLIEVTRTLDPLLHRRTAEGGLNGHVPVTAMNSGVALLVAVLLGFDDVVFANERSADEETVVVRGTPVNHQYSKSWAFEELFRAAADPAGVCYFSLTRELSELAIVSAVAAAPTLRGAIISCNRAYTTAARRSGNPQRWCLQCPKCLFTFLMFAVFLEPGEAHAMFGGDPLADPALAGEFAALWGAEKPFECVGERRESAVAMAHLARTPAWRGAPVVVTTAESAEQTRAAVGAGLDDLLAPRGPHGVPDAHHAALLAALAAGRAPLPVGAAPAS